jgi:transcription-repair coupling factor (superfamily II helicase)
VGAGADSATAAEGRRLAQKIYVCKSFLNHIDDETMNLAFIRQQHLQDKRVRELAHQIGYAATPPVLQVQGLFGSQEAFVWYALQQITKRSLLIVAIDKEAAAHVANDLETILEIKDGVLFLPDSFAQPLRFDKINRSQLLQRTETVSKLSTAPKIPKIVVTYPEALFEKIVAPEVLQRASINIKKGEQLDLSFLAETLREYGFDEVDFAFEAGQFAIRGGIVDIYSYGNEYPYRIDMLDDEVESLRTFDPVSQLSVQKISELTIIPNINTQFAAKEKSSFLSLLDVENTLVIISNPNFVMDKLEESARLLEDYATQNSHRAHLTDEERALLDGGSFWHIEQAKEEFYKFALLQLGSQTYFATNKAGMRFQTQAQPSFNKNFELLIRHLHQNTANGLQNFIFAENAKQIERFGHIFADMQVKVKWIGINSALHQGFFDETLGLACYTDHQIFERYHAYRLRKGFDRNNALQIKALQDLKIGDYVTHIDHGVGKYAGLEKIVIQGKAQEAVRLLYRDNDILYVSIHSLHKISKFTGKDSEVPSVHKLGSGTWAATKQKAKRKIKELAFDLIQLYARRRAANGYAYPEDTYLQNELEASFIYEDTPDQARASEDVRVDMQKSYPMDRLICGDVGFGKTEIAIRAAFRAAVDGKQVAILVPTTILALQHANTFTERLKEFGVTVDYINRFRTTKEKTEIYKQLAEGKINILIGTHAILNEKVKFKSLGLLIIDEEQKFGVGAKEKMRHLKVNIDTLTLTATPIPRTLQFSLMAARDLSIINTPPPNRQPIHTEVRSFDPEQIKTAIELEISRGGQVFFLHNRVQNLAEMAALIKQQLPNIDVGIAHGQMDVKHLEETLLNFIKGYYDVLVCTNIIETGLDIPNANTIIINNAHHFGLSDLHQLRGRVGRSNKKAHCYLLSPPVSVLTNEARQRLQTIEQFAELGAGFQIAMKDLDIRGAGDILGGEQSGFISNIGYETYHKILEETIQELKENEYQELFAEELKAKATFSHDVNIESDEEMLFPDSYINSVEERLSLYQQLNKIEREEEIVAFKTKLSDRFGAPPASVENLFDALRLRRLGKALGLERIIVQSRKLRCYFVSNPQAPFYATAMFQAILSSVQRSQKPRFSLKQNGNSLLFSSDDVRNLQQAKATLEQIQTAAYQLL